VFDAAVATSDDDCDDNNSNNNLLGLLQSYVQSTLISKPM